MNRLIFFLTSAIPHLPYLTTALWTLKEFWNEEIRVYAYPESISLVETICADKHLNAKAVSYTPKRTGRNSQFLNKISIAQQIEADVSLYLDCDVTTHGSLEPLFYYANKNGFCSTQFCDWRVASRMMRSRLETLREFDIIDKDILDQTLEGDWPSVNGGVWACRPDSPVLNKWLEWSVAANSTFIPDEKVLHLMQTFFSTVMYKPFYTLCEEGQYNCSPKYQSDALKDEHVVIRHFHGDSNVRRNKSEKGYKIWRPIFQECLDNNVGSICDWYKDVGNKYLNRTLKEEKERDT